MDKTKSNSKSQNSKSIPQVRSDLIKFTPYQVPHFRVPIELDSNENPWNLPAEIIKEIQDSLKSFEFNRYPDISAFTLRRIISEAYGLKPQNILVGNGSNEVILYLLLAFGGTERLALTFEPTYSMHSVIARISGTKIKSIPLRKNFDIDLELALEALQKFKPTIVFVCSPNNPTGNLAQKEVVKTLLNQGRALIIVDEAYGEFANQSVLDLLSEYPNLAVVKTFSKAFRLANLRVGYLLSSEQIISSLEKVKLPYNLNGFSQMVAEIAYRKREVLLPVLDEIIKERQRVFKALKNLEGITPFPSQANFILFRTGENANKVFSSLLEKGILIRNFSHKPGLENCLRVTIGTPEENNAFLEALERSV